MSLAYAIPLSVFRWLFAVVDPGHHQQLAERLRVEIHADLGRRLSASGLHTITSPSETNFESAVVGDEIHIYEPGRRQGIGRRARNDLAPPARKGLAAGHRRYPGAAGNGVYAAAVNAVLGRSKVLAREFGGER